MASPTPDPESFVRLLQSMGLTPQELSKRTGILVSRLYDIYHHGNPSPKELKVLAHVLTAKLASFVSGGTVQTGNFNIVGNHNQQIINLNVIHIHQTPDPENSKSRTPMLHHAPQPWGNYALQPAGQVERIGK